MEEVDDDYDEGDTDKEGRQALGECTSIAQRSHSVPQRNATVDSVPANAA